MFPILAGLMFAGSPNPLDICVSGLGGRQKNCGEREEQETLHQPDLRWKGFMMELASIRSLGHRLVTAHLPCGALASTVCTDKLQPTNFPIRG